MLAITVEFLLGSFRADPSGQAHTGRLQQGEWPPAPTRLFAALVAADGTRDRCRYTTGVELEYLEAAPPPTIYANDLADVHHQPLHGRYVVEQTGKATKGKAHHEYHARRGALVRPGVRVAPKVPRVVYLWEDSPSAQVLDGLRARARRIGYLGTADSPVAVTVGTTVPDELPGRPFVPDEGGDLAVGVPRPGILAALDAHFDLWMQHGPSVHRSQTPGLRRLATYRSPSAPPPGEAPETTTIWLVLDEPIPGRRVAAVTSTFKAAVLDLHQRTVGEPPAVLHGHMPPDVGEYRLARYLALPDVGHRWARGLIRGLALVLPADCPPDLVANVRGALYELRDLRGPGFRRTVHPWSGERRPRAVDPRNWTRPSTHFATAFPAVHERRKVSIDIAEVARWCEHADLPPPAQVRSSRGPLIEGGVDLHPREVNRPGRPPMPFSHLEVLFDEPVTGPVVLGSARQRGLGLCWPVDRGGGT